MSTREENHSQRIAHDTGCKARQEKSRADDSGYQLEDSEIHLQDFIGGASHLWNGRKFRFRIFVVESVTEGNLQSA